MPFTFWYALSYNEGIPWSLNIINEFYDLWVWENLTWNMKLWEKVFYPYMDDDVIDAPKPPSGFVTADGVLVS